MRKRKKIILVASMVIVVLALSFNRIVNVAYYYMDGYYDRQSAELTHMIESVMKVPYSKDPQYRNDNSGIISLSKDEWFALPYYARSSEVDLVEDELHLVETMPTAKEAEHALSLRIRSIWPLTRLGTPIYHKLCSNFLTCELLTVVLQDYVLKRPEILENIIKIAERPCDYIRTIDEVKPEDQIGFTTSFGLFGHKFATVKYDRDDIEKNGIGAARKRLSCDKRSFFDGLLAMNSPSLFLKKFVLIVINKEGMVTGKEQKSIEIIVSRKDI